MARLQRLFLIRSRVTNNNHPIAADIIVVGIISGVFYIDNGILIVVCCVYSLESPR